MSTQALAYTDLLGSSGTGAPAAGTGAGSSGITCSSVSGLLRVHPGNASSSLIWEKVNSKLQGTVPPCGSPMPAGATNPALSQAQVDEIAAWINAGALNNCTYSLTHVVTRGPLPCYGREAAGAA
jgi:hypothetical protein